MPIEPARVWTGSSHHAAFGARSFGLADGAADRPTVLAAQTCEATTEQPPRSDCRGEGGTLALSFDTPSGVAADLAQVRFDEAGWWGAEWVGDVDGDGVREVAAAPVDDGLGVQLFHPSGLPRKPAAEGHVVLPPQARLHDPDHADCGDLDGDGVDELCFTLPSQDAVLVAFGPLDGAGWPWLAMPANGYPLPLGDLDGDGVDELLLVPPGETGSSRWVWRPDAAAFDTEDGNAALGGCSDDGEFWPVGFRTGDGDGDGTPDLFDGQSLLRGPAILDPAAGCDALVITTFDDPDRTIRGGATGDLDGDGVSDLILLAVDAAEHAEVQLHRGPLPPGTFDSGHAELVLPWTGEAPFSAVGSLDVADVDGDGRDDLAVAMGAPRFSPPGMGAVYLWRGIELLPPR